MKYPQFSTTLSTQHDKFLHPGGIDEGAQLQALSYNALSRVLAAGASEETASIVAFVAPCKMKVTGFKSIMQVVQTGADNTPVVQLRKGASTVVAATAAIALSGAIRQVNDGVLSSTAADLICAKGDVLSVDIVNPAATITVALQVIGQIEWEPVV